MKSLVRGTSALFFVAAILIATSQPAAALTPFTWHTWVPSDQTVGSLMAPAEAGRDITAAYFAADGDYSYFRMDLKGAPGAVSYAPLYSILIDGSSSLNTFAMSNPIPPFLPPLIFASGGSPSLFSSQQTGKILEWAVKRSDLPGTFSWYGLSGNYDGSGLSDIFDITHSAVATPIPSAALLLGTGLVGLVGLRRRSARKA
jgi:hypothetical protein